MANLNYGNGKSFIKNSKGVHLVVFNYGKGVFEKFKKHR